MLSVILVASGGASLHPVASTPPHADRLVPSRPRREQQREDAAGGARQHRPRGLAAGGLGCKRAPRLPDSSSGIRCALEKYQSDDEFSASCTALLCPHVQDMSIVDTEGTVKLFPGIKEKEVKCAKRKAAHSLSFAASLSQACADRPLPPPELVAVTTTYRLPVLRLFVE